MGRDVVTVLAPGCGCQVAFRDHFDLSPALAVSADAVALAKDGLYDTVVRTPTKIYAQCQDHIGISDLATLFVEIEHQHRQLFSTPCGCQLSLTFDDRKRDAVVVLDSPDTVWCVDHQDVLDPDAHYAAMREAAILFVKEHPSNEEK